MIYMLKDYFDKNGNRYKVISFNGSKYGCVSYSTGKTIYMDSSELRDRPIETQKNMKLSSAAVSKKEETNIQKTVEEAEPEYDEPQYEDYGYSEEPETCETPKDNSEGAADFYADYV